MSDSIRLLPVIFRLALLDDEIWSGHGEVQMATLMISVSSFNSDRVWAMRFVPFSINTTRGQRIDLFWCSTMQIGGGRGVQWTNF